MVFVASLCVGLRYVGVFGFPCFLYFPKGGNGGFGGKHLLSERNEAIALGVVNEVVQKASTLTANGDPSQSGRSLSKGLAFLSTAPTG